MSMLLAHYGFAVATAETGETAIEEALVLSDPGSSSWISDCPT